MTEFPDLRPAFTHYRWAAMPHSMGALVGCDWSDKPPDDPLWGNFTRNGSLTVDEAQLLWLCAKQVGGKWLDIGGSTGWSAAHAAKASGIVVVDSIDPMYANPEFEERAVDNLVAATCFYKVTLWPLTSAQFFARLDDSMEYQGALIDGCHDAPVPEQDAVQSASHLGETGVIVFHDGFGKPIQDGVRALAGLGFKVRPYPTPQGLIVCWRGDFEPPPYEQPSEMIRATADRYYKGLSSG